MKLVMTLLVRDEEDIIRDNIEYHLAQGVDFIIATDNLSVDGTAGILREYESKGLLHYIFEGEDNYNQYAWVTRMARMACTEFRADWVINNDADEFWWPDGGNLKSILEHQSAAIDGLTIERSNFVFLGDHPDQPFWGTQIYRERRSLNHFGNPLPPKVAHRARADINVCQGNHLVSVDNETLKLVRSDQILIFHFPIHDRSQFKNKIAAGGAAYDRNQELRNKVGRFWLESFLKNKRDPTYLDAYLTDHTLDPSELSEKLVSGELVEEVRLRDFMSKL